jgi:tight adherence protein B
MLTNAPLLFPLVMVFIAVFLLTQSLIVRSSDQRAIKRMRRRIRQVTELYQDSSSTSLLHERYRREQSFLERWLERLPGVAALQRMLVQSGYSSLSVHRFMLVSVGLMVVAAAVGWWLSNSNILITIFIGLFAGFLPFFKLNKDRNKRLATFEEQLPQALEIMIHALRTGYPFIETLNVVAEEMENPIREEFATTFADINYGMDIRIAFLKLLERTPSVSLLSLITAVLIQRETGGNLTELLEKISLVIRGRFRFQRRVLTLSAEARISAWILVLVPFVLFGVISLISPNYVKVLTTGPGVKLVEIAFVIMVVGILWIRRLLKKVMEI